MTRSLLTNARIATLSGESGYGLLDDAALLVNGAEIEWIGAMAKSADINNVEIIDCGGRLVTPGLIDCHTHLVYGGERADEFEQRLEGLSYTEIAQRGGGIRSTVEATRAASENDLMAQAKPRLQQLLSEGVTTIEIKSGYGLDSENEIKMLRVARRIGEQNLVRVQKTFLGAHALPAEFADNSDGYIQQVCEFMLPAAQAEGLVDAVDVFIESIAFNLSEAKQVFEKARALGIPVKAHVEQLSDMGGTGLACEFDALSVDHIEYLKAEDVQQLAAKNTVAVLLPGAFYVLGETQSPPIEALQKHNITIAIASDANPGSSPVFSILLTMNLACTLFRLTPTEALRGVTINAAKALGLDEQIGSLEVGKQADIAIWDVNKPSMLAYQIGINPCVGVMQAGQWRHRPDI